jgi:hypothetical protein
MLGLVSAKSHNRYDLFAVGSLLLISLPLNFIGLGWGLPNGNNTWAPDALDPMTPLAVVYRLLTEGWNSGWFYFKYPPGHPILLSFVYLPYLVWLWATGQLANPTTNYPFGFADPEHAMLVLALLGRSVSALMVTAATLLWCGACRELLTRRAAWLAAWFFATLFPVVYYAHTTNVEAAMLFWMMLAVYGAARVIGRGGDRLGMILVGVGSAMSLSTKEQAFGVVIILPLMLLVNQIRTRRMAKTSTLIPDGSWAGVGAALAVFVIMNGILINPLGVWHRLQFLTLTLPEDLRAQYAPYYFPISFGGPNTIAGEMTQLRVALDLVGASIGLPLMFAAALGFLVAGWNRSGIFFSVLALGYYLICGRALLLPNARYLLPVTIMAAAFAAIAVDRLVALAGERPTGRRLASIVMVALAAYAAMAGADATRLLIQDTRYGAERWLQTNVPHGATIEVYQNPTYLPRFPTTAHISKVPLQERSIAQFLSRRPEFVVTSSAGAGGMTRKYATDWHAPDGELDPRIVKVGVGPSHRMKLLEYESSRIFVEALEQDCLDYARVIQFEAHPWIAVPVIPTLAPTIQIYRHMGPAATTRQKKMASGCHALVEEELKREAVSEGTSD